MSKDFGKKVTHLGGTSPYALHVSTPGGGGGAGDAPEAYPPLPMVLNNSML